MKHRILVELTVDAPPYRLFAGQRGRVRVWDPQSRITMVVFEDQQFTSSVPTPLLRLVPAVDQLGDLA